MLQGRLKNNLCFIKIPLLTCKGIGTHIKSASNIKVLRYNVYNVIL